MQKSLENYFIDWEDHVFGYGYGDGQFHIIPALRKFFDLCTASSFGNVNYDFEILEKELTPTVTWFLINIFAKHEIIYGTSPRFGFLTKQGQRLAHFMTNNSIDDMIELCTNFGSGYIQCAPHYCNCEPNFKCDNPFWNKKQD